MRTAAAIVLAGVVWASQSQAQVPYSAMDCDELWFARNLIFKDSGYCFRTARAIRQFGNAGCRYDDQESVPLSNVDRQNIRAIQSWEARRGCPR